MPNHRQRTDEDLLRTFRDERDDGVFTELVRRHLPMVFHVAMRRLGSAALAEEAAQNTFTCLADKVAVVCRHPERLRSWLHRAAYFESSTLARKEARLTKIPIQPASPPHSMERSELHEKLDAALSRLPELDRELILRHCCAGEEYGKLATVFGKSAAACQKRVERALAGLARAMGGAKTAGSVVAALSVVTAESHALPSAGKIAGAALKGSCGGSSVAGAMSGASWGACAIMLVAGGLAGWEQKATENSSVYQLPTGAQAVHTKSQRHRGERRIEASLPPRAAPVSRTLDDVLETVLAGRLLPLVEFLPEASVADLQAIMAEDDLAYLSEGMGGFGIAHGLAAQRWVELQPEEAFQYGIKRSRNLAATMLSRWLATDPGAAGKAFRDLPLNQRVSIATELARQDEIGADRLATADPDTAWAIVEHRYNYPGEKVKRLRAEEIVDRVTSSQEGVEPNDIHAITSAFRITASHDRASALKAAESIPWPKVRDSVLQALAPPPPTIGERMIDEPETVFRELREAAPGPDRDALLASVQSSLSPHDTWRFLSLVESLEGEFSASRTNLVALVEEAGKRDPKRVLSMLPGIATRTPEIDSRDLAMAVAQGWMRVDPVAAIKWAAKAGLELEGGWGGCPPFPDALLELISDEDPLVRNMAVRAMPDHLSSLTSTEDLSRLLEKMPREIAEEMMEKLTERAQFEGNHRYEAELSRLIPSETRAATTQQPEP